MFVSKIFFIQFFAGSRSASLSLYSILIYYFIVTGMISWHALQTPQSKSTSLFPTASHKWSEQSDHRLRTPKRTEENHKIVGLIGYDRLLSSMDRLAPIIDSRGSKPKQQIPIDRFIPDRRMALNNYDKQQNPEDLMMIEQDPQNVSITEIYQEQILGGRNKEASSDQQLRPFKNKNILRFGMHQTENTYENDPHPLGLGQSNVHRVRKVNKVPCKVLDAPALQDDFYLNLIDWSSSNQLAVGLGHCIYLWNADTSKVTKLCELQNDLVTSVGWSPNSQLLAVGCNRGEVQLWDVQYGKLSRSMGGHDNRVGALAWNSSQLSTGSRDKSILFRDIRARRDFSSKLLEHTQQICGLRWSLDQQHLASGGNDNKVGVWSKGGQLINRYTDHRAAVKALAWSPQQHGLLATGGGTADRTLRLRNVLTGQVIAQKDTGSQICNLSFSRSTHELVSTHGYSQNEINIWSYPKLKRVATLIGHTHRVLYLAMNPDGSTVVTGAGDETLRFWNIFPGPSKPNDKIEHKILEGLSLR